MAPLQQQSRIAGSLRAHPVAVAGILASIGLYAVTGMSGRVMPSAQASRPHLAPADIAAHEENRHEQRMGHLREMALRGELR